MTEPASHALVMALRALWIATPAVAALVGDRIYDRIPRGAALPYVQFGERQTLDEGTDCGDSAEVAIDVHVWSEAPAAVEAERILGALRSAIRTADAAGTIAPPGWRAVRVHCPQSRTFADPDGLTTHGVLTVEAYLDPAL